MSVQIGEKKKINKFNEYHQNPYLPQKVQISKASKANVQQWQQQEQKEMTSKQICIEENEKQQNFPLIYDKQLTENRPEDSDRQEVDQYPDYKLTQTNNNNFNHISLPQNFNSLNIQDKYIILSKQYTKDKKILEKRFYLIYQHYRKTMYILYESFQINNQLLIDLKIFLKYFKDFQINKKFKTNDALKVFKKIASNGLWLNQKNFISIHYKLIDLLDVNLAIGNFESSDPQNVQLMKKEVVKSIKQLQENLIKLKELSQLVSEDKLKQVLKTGKPQNMVKKIIESHSGLTQQDVLLKLKERIEMRKSKKLEMLSNEKTDTHTCLSHNKSKYSKLNDRSPQRDSLMHQNSIYKQISLPKLGSRQLRNSSIYASLQLLNIQKEKEKLKQLIREKNNETYLKEFFRREKIINSPVRSYSLGLEKAKMNCYTENFDSQTSRTPRLPKIQQRNFSLPRMRFT